MIDNRRIALQVVEGSTVTASALSVDSHHMRGGQS